MIPILTLEPIINQQQRVKNTLFSYQSQREFLFLEIISLSFYSFLWWNFQWSHYKQSPLCHKWLKPIPSWMLAILAPLLGGIIFFSVAKIANLEKVRFDWEPSILNAIYFFSLVLFVVAFITHLQYPFFLIIGILRFVPLYFVQGTINQICEKYPLNASQNLNGKLTHATTITGISLWTLLLSALFISHISPTTIAKMAIHHQSYELAQRLLINDAYKGNPKAQSILGSLYLHGLIANPEGSAELWYKRAANQGDPSAYLGLGMIYQYGIDNSKDYGKAMQCYEEAIQNGVTYAFTQLARLYEMNSHFPQHIEQAIALYKEGAKAGDPQSQYQLGNHYLSGSYIEKNTQKGIYWINKSANEGCPCAQYRLGLLAMEDTSNPRHKQIAMSWFSKVAQNPRLTWILSTNTENNLSPSEYTRGFVQYMLQQYGEDFLPFSLPQKNAAKLLTEKLEKKCTVNSEDNVPDLELNV